MKIDLWQSYNHCCVFLICWHIECSTMKASSFWEVHSSTGIPSHPLALLTVEFPKVPWLPTQNSWLCVTENQHNNLVRSDISCTFLPCIISTLWSFQRLLGLYCCWPYCSTHGQNAPLIFPVFMKRFYFFLLLLFSSSFMHCLMKAFLFLGALLFECCL